MANFVLIHGAGGTAWDWHLVEPELRERGHGTVAVELPCEDESAGLTGYADTVLEAIGDLDDLVLVGHSLGGFTAPLVCARVPARLLVLVAGMVPSPGETGIEWWDNTGWQDAAGDRSDRSVFLHDVDPGLADDALARWRHQTMTPMREPWPLEAWPDVPTRYILCRGDRMFAPDWTRRMVEERLRITPDEIDGGHCPYLARPKQLAERLASYC